MAEIAGVAVGVLRIVARLSTLLQEATKFEHKYRPLQFADHLEELSILRNVLAESALMMEDLRGKPPASAEIALRRCAGLAEEVSSIMTKLLHYDKKRIANAMANRWDDHLSSLMNSFKSAVLLLRDISTE